MREADQKGLETVSEAVYLDCVTDHGRSGFIVRLCRYPEKGFAWAWGHVFLDGQVHAVTNNSLGCDAAVTDLSGRPTSYQLDWRDGAVAFTRDGDREAPERANLETRFLAHRSRHAPHGNGTLACRISATFEPAAAAVSNRAGRSEVLGTCTASIRLAGQALAMTGRGQFHEQVQTDPRFTAPFSYLSLRGADIGLIGVRGPRGARGHLLADGDVRAIDQIVLTPPGSLRMVALRSSGQAVTSGWLRTTYDYSIPAFDGYRPGTLVAGDLGGMPVAGCINDYLLDRMRYDRTIDTPAAAGSEGASR